MSGGSSARIGAMRVRWRRPHAKQASLTGVQTVQALTYGLFVAFVSIALLEIVGFQLLVCGGDASCDGLDDVHAAYLGIVVAPTTIVAGLMVSRWNMQRMRAANAHADWVKKQAGTK